MRTLLALVIAATPALALDFFDFADLRVGATTVGSSLTATVNGAEQKDKWDQARRYSLDWVAGNSFVLFGIAYGAGVTIDRRSNDDADQRTTIGRLQAGPYLSLGPVHLELLGFYGRGSSKLESNNEEDRAFTKEYGADLNAVVSIAHLVVGARVGLLKQDADFDFQTSSVSVENSDYTAGVFAGFRF